MSRRDTGRAELAPAAADEVTIEVGGSNGRGVHAPRVEATPTFVVARLADGTGGTRRFAVGAPEAVQSLELSHCHCFWAFAIIGGQIEKV